MYLQEFAHRLNDFFTKFTEEFTVEVVNSTFVTYWVSLSELLFNDGYYFINVNNPIKAILTTLFSFSIFYLLWETTRRRSPNTNGPSRPEGEKFEVRIMGLKQWRRKLNIFTIRLTNQFVYGPIWLKIGTSGLQEYCCKTFYIQYMAS